jgi:ubiquinone/menaquinone biosynthesis C-methylase UbiE
LPRPAFDAQEIWEKLYAAEDIHEAGGLRERSWTEGEDGEREFDRRVLAAAKNRDVIDIGCGTGEFSLEIAARARRVAGIDFSERALRKAQENLQSKKLANVEFKHSPADNIPYADQGFDLAISRRGPATDTIDSTREVYRVLRRGGQLMVQAMGQRDKQNWIQVFSRGGIFPGTAEFDSELEKRLVHVGFRDVNVEEFEANEYFESIQDVLIRLEDSPIVPDFDKDLDKQYVQEIVKLFTTPKGIRTNSQRVLIRATK